jgi:rare lipoprotein A
LRNLSRATLVACLALLPLGGCDLFRHQATLQPHPHYVLEQAWQGDGVWFYPHQDLTYDETGLASVYAEPHPAVTADGEIFDQGAMAAASQTLQLPAIARITNLETGRQVVVRINDRGPANPARLIMLTRRAAGLLGIPEDGTAEVRVQVETEPSQALVDALHGAAEHLSISAAPQATVEAQALPPPGAAASGVGAQIPSAIGQNDTPLAEPALPPLNLPATVAQGLAQPGQLWLRGDSFARRDYAERQRAQLAGLNPQIAVEQNGRFTQYQILAGPFASVEQADAALDQALREGVTDARIYVQ